MIDFVNSFIPTFFNEDTGIISCPKKVSRAAAKLLCNSFGLILSVFDYVPQCSGITMYVVQDSIDMIQVLTDIGFVMSPLTGAYELVVGDRCKLCEVLYGKDFWENQDPDSQDDDFAVTGEDWGAYDSGMPSMKNEKKDADDAHPVE